MHMFHLAFMLMVFLKCEMCRYASDRHLEWSNRSYGSVIALPKTFRNSNSARLMLLPERKHHQGARKQHSHLECQWKRHDLAFGDKADETGKRRRAMGVDDDELNDAVLSGAFDTEVCEEEESRLVSI
ncbi:hypothetical protein ANCDUO_04184 [Ancylostoma duodenale]|uniref:Secreted protein n=1 Tax=Ancylostoma duodenale TaxID=51022 RepID=A0A0C2H7T2_9BILA|nr:hypothetical protein ANCDUO_04184 [Ancylostoma duodenale]